MLSSINLPFALGMSIIKYVLNDLYVCPFIVRILFVKIKVLKFDFSQMIFREITCLNRISPLENRKRYHPTILKLEIGSSYR